MENTEEYIVQKCKNGKGSLFFYKNGLLHREAGPAIVTFPNRKTLTKLGDENLYKEKIVKSDFPEHYSPDPIDKSELINGKIALIHSIAIFYLEGKPYSQEEFEQIKGTFILKNELSKELLESDKLTKKVKL